MKIQSSRDRHSKHSSMKDLDSVIIDKAKRNKPKKVDRFPEEPPRPQPKIKAPPVVQQVEKINEEDYNKCLGYLSSLKKHPSVWPFLKPVDAKALGIPEYFEIIKEPMDISTVEKNLKAHAYTNINQFHVDVNKIWQNSFNFNQRGSDIYKLTAEMDRYYKKISAFKPQPAKVSAIPHHPQETHTKNIVVPSHHKETNIQPPPPPAVTPPKQKNSSVKQSSTHQSHTQVVTTKQPAAPVLAQQPTAVSSVTSNKPAAPIATTKNTKSTGVSTHHIKENDHTIAQKRELAEQIRKLNPYHIPGVYLIVAESQTWGSSPGTVSEAGIPHKQVNVEALESDIITKLEAYVKECQKKGALPLPVGNHHSQTSLYPKKEEVLTAPTQVSILQEQIRSADSSSFILDSDDEE